MVCAASLFVSSKYFDEYNKIEKFAKGYYEAKCVESPTYSNFNKYEKVLKSIKDKIAVTEALVIKLLVDNRYFNLNQYSQDLSLDSYLPHRYLSKYCDLLFKFKANYSIKEVLKASKVVCNDSFYTEANLIYNPKDVALACILIAARLLTIYTPLSKYYEREKFLSKFPKEENSTENQEFSFEEKWFELLDMDINIEHVNQIAKILKTLYDQY